MVTKLPKHIIYYISLYVDQYDKEKDKDRVSEDFDDVRELAKHSMFNKGQSKRIWNELFKVNNSIFFVAVQNQELNG